MRNLVRRGTDSLPEWLTAALDLGLENLRGMFRYAVHTFNLAESLRKNDNGKISTALRLPFPRGGRGGWSRFFPGAALPGLLAGVLDRPTR
jgi:hypothetical protein